MNYILDKGSVISFIPKACTFKLTCIHGKVWVTKSSGIHDFVLLTGDRITIEKEKTSAIEAFGKTCLDLEGQKFDLIELTRKNHQIVRKTVKINMKNWSNWITPFRRFKLLLKKA